MCLNQDAVKKYTMRVFQKLGVSSRAELLALATDFHAGIYALRELDAPLVAGVQGAAAGGGLALACACDIVLAAESARFTMAYTAAGLSPDGGSSWFLPRLVGIGLPGHREILVGLYRPVLGRQIAHVTIAGHDGVIVSEIFVDRLGLGR